MGRLHCVESDCVTVWVKTPGQKEITEERILAGKVHVESNFDKYHPWYLNNINTNVSNGLTFDNVVDWRIEHEGNYCDVNEDNFRYLVIYHDVDFEIVSGQDFNFNAVTVPRMQVKRLVLGRNLNTGYTVSNALLIKYSQNTDPDSACNLQFLDPRDYGGSTLAWYAPYTPIFYYNNPQEEASLILDFQDGTTTTLTIRNSYNRDYYIFDGREPFNLHWQRIDEIETILIQPEIKDSWQAFKVEKQPYLEKVEVVNFAYDFSPFGGVLNPNQTLEIPRNCLNIYRTETNPSSGILGLGNVGAEFIAQFCTDDPADIEPPEYYVVCGCDQCPPGTCEIDCGDHICCYNSEGVAEVIINK